MSMVAKPAMLRLPRLLPNTADGLPLTNVHAPEMSICPTNPLLKVPEEAAVQFAICTAPVPRKDWRAAAIRQGS